MGRAFSRRAFKRAIWSSFSRLVGVGLGAGAGSLVYKLTGGGLHGWGVAVVLAVASFALMTFAEYERELDDF